MYTALKNDIVKAFLIRKEVRVELNIGCLVTAVVVIMLSRANIASHSQRERSQVHSSFRHMVSPFLMIIRISHSVLMEFI